MHNEQIAILTTTKPIAIHDLFLVTSTNELNCASNFEEAAIAQARP